MVKKSIIAIALMGMLASVTFAADPFPGAPSGQIKVDGQWPTQYVPLEICRIPIVMDIGMFIEIRDCAFKKIVLKQITCENNRPFPCYKGCVTITVRANFEAQLGLKLYKTSDIISSMTCNAFFCGGCAPITPDNWEAYFRADKNDITKNPTWIIAGDGNDHNVDVCVEAWDANIYKAPPGNDACKSAVPVGQVAVTAVPTSAAACSGYCPPKA
jgi:hypothetical protein